MNKFKGSRRIWWIIGMVVMVAGVTAALIVLPAVSATPGSGGPEIHVPKMQNVPQEGAPKMRLDYSDQR